jgi:alpha-glucosidase
VWWRNAVIYEIAVISFQDSNGDGRGDLPGLLQRIEYIKWLGVGAVWLTLIYKTPNQDFGYDIADFCAIDPRYGTMEDFERVRDALHEAGIKLILDFVPNHTSDQHAWFAESRASRNKPIGTFGRRLARMAGHPTTGSAGLAAADGNGARRADNSTTIRF